MRGPSPAIILTQMVSSHGAAVPEGTPKALSSRNMWVWWPSLTRPMDQKPQGQRCPRNEITACAASSNVIEGERGIIVEVAMLGLSGGRTRVAAGPAHTSAGRSLT